MTELHTPTSTSQTMDRDALSQAILNLENGLVEPVEDPQLAYELGHNVKPMIDRFDQARVMPMSSGSIRSRPKRRFQTPKI